MHHLFNLGAMSLATATAGHVYLALGGGTDPPGAASMLPLLAAAAVHFAANTVLASAVIALHRRRGFLEVWCSCCVWTFVSMMTAAVLALGMILFVQAAGFWSLAVALPSVLPLAAYHQLQGVRLENSPAAGHST